MTSSTSTNDSTTELQKRRVPCFVTYLHPFRIVSSPEFSKWEATIQQVNSRSWDYVALHEMVGGIDVGLKSPYHLVVCRDGGLALPPVPQLRHDQTAVEFFNKCLAAILLGGIYCEAINLDALDFGSIIDWKYVRVSSSAPAAPNRFHNLIRGQYAPPIEAIALDAPRTIEFKDLMAASQSGWKILEHVPELQGEFLLKGVTGYSRRDWGSSLANLWIVVEQITSHLWSRDIIQVAKKAGAVQGRIDGLNDNRTWTMASRLELLFQLEIIDLDTYSALSEARKARNRLSHDGKHPEEKAIKSVLRATKNMLVAVAPEFEIPFMKINLDDYSLTNPFEPIDRGPISPKYWMEIKKLPGETELEKAETEARKSKD